MQNPQITNAYENRMVMEREVIADRGIWVAKKRYILNVHNNEGVQYKTPKLKMMGIEFLQSSHRHHRSCVRSSRISSV